MAPSINWLTRVITVPVSDLTLLGGTLYVLDLNVFRLDLKDLEDDEIGMGFPKTHNHTPPHTLGGTNFAREIEIINGYTVTFEDGQYGVNAVGANSNIADVVNRNQVSLATANSAGLVQIGGADPLVLAAAVWDLSLVGHQIPNTFGETLTSRAAPGAAMTLTGGERTAVAGAMRTELATELGRLDVAVSTRSTSAGTAAALLDELLSGHFTPDSVGEALSIIRGMVQSNYVLDNTTYNASGLLTSGRIRIFPNAASASAATLGGVAQGELATFVVSVTALGTLANFYRVVRT